MRFQPQSKYPVITDPSTPEWTSARVYKWMHLQSILSKALLAATTAFNPNSQEKEGKPSKLLQVGRYPALGCIPRDCLADRRQHLECIWM